MRLGEIGRDASILGILWPAFRPLYHVTELAADATELVGHATELGGGATDELAAGATELAARLGGCLREMTR